MGGMDAALAAVAQPPGPRLPQQVACASAFTRPSSGLVLCFGHVYRAPARRRFGACSPNMPSVCTATTNPSNHTARQPARPAFCRRTRARRSQVWPRAKTPPLLLPCIYKGIFPGCMQGSSALDLVCRSCFSSPLYVLLLLLLLLLQRGREATAMPVRLKLCAPAERRAHACRAMAARLGVSRAGTA
jgi:hypothetical protein